MPIIAVVRDGPCDSNAMKPLLPGETSSKFLTKELEKIQRALAKTQEQQAALARGNANEATSDPTLSSTTAKPSKRAELQRLKFETDSLAFSQLLVEWISEAPDQTTYGSGEKDSSRLDPDIVVAEAEWCRRLAVIIVEYPTLSKLDMGFEVYNEIYEPLFHYVSRSLGAVIKRELESNNFYSVDGSSASLIEQCQSSPETCSFGQACRWLLELHKHHFHIAELIEVESLDQNAASMIIVRELVRPFVERIKFHFVEPSPERLTSTKIDRLPEWLVTFVKERMLEPDSGTPLELVLEGLSCCVPSKELETLLLSFMNEINRVVLSTLRRRNFFEHPDISGPGSNPLLLCNAVEQFLQYDQTVQDLIASQFPSKALYGLMDTIVMANEDLRQWWIERERESVFATLFEDDVNVTKPLANHVSPRAEVFCALIRSVQWKASTLAEPGFYLHNVAVPLCSQFVDALHSTSTDLRNLLSNPPLKGGIVDRWHLDANINEWIEIINGAHLASIVLSKAGRRESQSEHDLARFGQSLEKLRDVMAEEFATVFTESLLLEKAKLASYLMMASHLLASREWDHGSADLSVELKEAQDILRQFNQVCEQITATGGSLHMSTPEAQVAHFAPSRLQTLVMSQVATKFLEVVLDYDGTTPELWQEGAKVFASDVMHVTSAYTFAPPTKRLLDTVSLLTAGSARGLHEALSQLAQSPGPLHIEDFSSDLTLFEQAVFMMKAKGFQDLQLEDAISILNRRQD